MREISVLKVRIVLRARGLWGARVGIFVLSRLTVGSQQSVFASRFGLQS